MENPAPRPRYGQPRRKRIGLVALALLPIVGVWSFSIAQSARQTLALFEGPHRQPVSSPSVENAEAPIVAWPTAAAVTAQTAQAVAPSADEGRVELVSDAADATRELHSAADILPLLADYFSEADAEQTQQIAETVAEFFPAER
jgi:hypothetical protein